MQKHGWRFFDASTRRCSSRATPKTKRKTCLATRSSRSRSLNVKTSLKISCRAANPSAPISCLNSSRTTRRAKARRPQSPSVSSATRTSASHPSSTRNQSISLNARNLTTITIFALSHAVLSDRAHAAWAAQLDTRSPSKKWPSTARWRSSIARVSSSTTKTANRPPYCETSSSPSKSKTPSRPLTKSSRKSPRTTYSFSTRSQISRTSLSSSAILPSLREKSKRYTTILLTRFPDELNRNLTLLVPINRVALLTSTLSQEWSSKTGTQAKSNTSLFLPSRYDIPLHY